VTVAQNQTLSPARGTRLSISDADDSFSTVDIGFAFRFLGRVATSAHPSSNGIIAFLTPSSSLSNQALPSTRTPSGLVAWWWDDLRPGTTVTPASEIRTSLGGVAPNRVRRFTFVNVPRFGHSASDHRTVTAEVRLHETTDEIEIHYGTLTSAGSPSDFSASAGWEDSNGVSGADILGCGATCTAADWPASTIYTIAP